MSHADAHVLELVIGVIDDCRRSLDLDGRRVFGSGCHHSSLVGLETVRARVCVRVLGRVRVRVRGRVRAPVRVCARACACVRACVCAWAWAPAVGMTHPGVLYPGMRVCYTRLWSGWGSDGNVYNALRG